MMKPYGILLAGLLWAACDGTGASTSDLSSIVYAGSRWSDPAAIPVCYLNRGEIDSGLLADLEATLKKEYHDKTQIKFVRFDDCTAADQENLVIRVLLRRTYDWSGDTAFLAGGGLSFIGPSAGKLGGVNGESTLRIDVGTDGRYPAEGNSNRDFAIQQTRGVVLHEFGHAVGLAHEHERTDAPRCQDIQGSLGSDGRWIHVGTYDPNSIMNYCRSPSINTLSAGDVAGIDFLYPRTAPVVPKPDYYALLARDPKLCAEENAGQDGLDLRECTGGLAQSYRLVNAGGRSFAIQDEATGRCLEVPSGNLEIDARVVLAPCRYEANQRLYFRETGEGFYNIIFAHSNFCMDHSRSAEGLLQLVQATCVGGLSQDYKVEAFR